MKKIKYFILNIILIKINSLYSKMINRKNHLEIKVIS